MARNRKHQSAAIRFGPALKVVLLCVLFCSSGLGFVWQKSQIGHLSQERKKRETRLRELQDTNEKLRRQFATMQTPAQIDRRVKELNLGLASPQPNQVLRLVEPEPETATPSSAQYAAGRAVSPIP